MTKTIFLSSIFMLLFNSFSFSKKNSNPNRISLKKAIEKGYVTILLRGVYDGQFYEDIVDKDGLHFGKCMGIVLQSTTENDYILLLKAGTQLIPDDSTFQTMIVTKTIEFPLFKGSYYATKFYAMCGQFHDEAPFINSTYKVAGLAENNIVRLATYFDKNYIQNIIGQHALWAYTDNTNVKELFQYGADSASIALSASILDSVGLKTQINPKKKAVNKTLEKDTKSPVIMYLLAGLSAIFFTTTLILFVKKKPNIQ